MKTIEGLPGEHISFTAQRAIEESKRHQENVMFKFNGETLFVEPSNTVQDIEKEYDRLCQVARERYQNSPEGIAQIAKEKQARKNAVRQFEWRTNDVISQITSQDLTVDDLSLLKEWCELSDNIHIRAERAQRVGKHFRQIGFMSIKEIPQEVRDAANRKEYLPSLHCVLGNIIDMIERCGSVHPISQHFLSQLIEEKENLQR